MSADTDTTDPEMASETQVAVGETPDGEPYTLPVEYGQGGGPHLEENNDG